MKPTHAGGVVVRRDGEQPRYLLVRAKRESWWVLPKGHIEKGETPEQAAVREVAEEAGVAGEIVAPLGTVEFTGPKGLVRTLYYLMRYTGETPSDERRELVWGTLADVLRRVQWPDLKELLRRAAEKGD